MAFSKAAIEKKLDADSKYFDLYKKANDAAVKMYAKADENKEKYKDSGFQIVDTESNIFQKIDELIKSKQIDIGVRLTKRFVSMINTKPDKAKAKRLLNSINNAIKNERIMKDNRLFDQVKHAKAELEDYLNEDDALDPVNYVDRKKASKGKAKDTSDNVVRFNEGLMYQDTNTNKDKEAQFSYGIKNIDRSKNKMTIVNELDVLPNLDDGKIETKIVDIKVENDVEKAIFGKDGRVKLSADKKLSQTLNEFTEQSKKEVEERNTTAKIKSDILKIGIKHNLINSGMNKARTYNGHQILEADEIGMMGPAEIIPGMNGKEDVEKAVNKKILEKIKTGEKLPPWKKSWASFSPDPAQNFETKKEYSGSNALILNTLLGSIMKTPYYLTFNQIKKMGGELKKGSTGVPLIFYNFIYNLKDYSNNPSKENALLSKVQGFKLKKKGKTITINKSNYSKVSFNEKQIKKLNVDKDDYTNIGFIKYYSVFNIADTTGIDYKVPEPPKRNKGEIISRAEAILKSFKDKPDIKEDTEQAYYVPSSDKVYIPKITQFDTEQEYYSTLFHELIHSTMHKSRLNRAKNYEGKDSKPARAFEELIAELGASYLCGEAGIIDVTHLNQAAYLKGWHQKLQKYTEKHEDFFVYATREAKKAADHILKDFDESNIPKSDNKKTDEKAKAKARARARLRKRKTA